MKNLAEKSLCRWSRPHQTGPLRKRNIREKISSVTLNEYAPLSALSVLGSVSDSESETKSITSRGAELEGGGMLAVTGSGLIGGGASDVSLSRLITSR